ncbi:hypothetical protein [Spiroplasma endosymbiont of Lariophagus distinguendus]|nr:hypothetical protein [Spiroplasma endosymbiont of Lariophagus distinguendus]
MVVILERMSGPKSLYVADDKAQNLIIDSAYPIVLFLDCIVVSTTR